MSVDERVNIRLSADKPCEIKLSIIRLDKKLKLLNQGFKISTYQTKRN